MADSEYVSNSHHNSEVLPADHDAERRGGCRYAHPSPRTLPAPVTTAIDRDTIPSMIFYEPIAMLR
jgi:hypothetical protein